MHEAFLVNHHIEIGYGRIYGDNTRIAGGIDRQIVSFDDLSLGKAMCVPTLLGVSFFLIAVTTL